MCVDLPRQITMLATPTERKQRENTTVLLTCTTDGGYPVPDVIIYRGTHILSSGKRSVTGQVELKRYDNLKPFWCKSRTYNLAKWKVSNDIIFHVLCKFI